MIYPANSRYSKHCAGNIPSHLLRNEGKVMKRWIVIVSGVFIVAVLVCVGTACQPKGLGTDNIGLDSDKGRVMGIVTDKEELLPEGTTPQTYEGALILVNEAVESGTYKLSADAPERINYVAGKEVAKVRSGKDGYWQIELEPGMYFIRAFYGDRSYSGNILIEVREGGEEHIVIELIHGV